MHQKKKKMEQNILIYPVWFSTNQCFALLLQEQLTSELEGTDFSLASSSLLSSTERSAVPAAAELVLAGANSQSPLEHGLYRVATPPVVPSNLVS